MNNNPNFVQKNWRWTLLSLKFVLLGGVVVTGLNIVNDLSQGLPFDWMHLANILVFFAFAALLYVFLRLIYKLVLAKTLHDEGRK